MSWFLNILDTNISDIILESASVSVSVVSPGVGTGAGAGVGVGICIGVCVGADISSDVGEVFPGVDSIEGLEL
ncbi:hypothetical protein BTHERMOSOX_716 [Bathymodiolus thermophilus thioautotrophic gill symbiont]|nr:hypothetical protein BTHERMOSOX_716 [Bathymodiolus thermophilus thioautotrophic gill symbiont]